MRHGFTTMNEIRDGMMENMLDANNERKEAELHERDNDISFDDEDDGEEEVKEGPEFTAQISDAA